MSKLRPRRALIVGILALGACTPIAVPAPQAAAVIVVPTGLPNGRVEITVASSYPLDTTASIPVTIIVTRGLVTGPVTARVVASGIGSPSEVQVRDLPVKPTVTGANARSSTTLTWDLRDSSGILVPAGAYTLLVDVRVEDGGAARTATAAATLELR